MKTAKTIDELYDEVRSYDIVISNDAALVTALNNRIDDPRVGRLASTPKMIARDHEDVILERLMKEGVCSDEGIYGTMDDVKLLRTISSETEYDVKFVHGEVENIKLIRRYTKDVEKYLFGKPSITIYKEFMKQPTIEMVMSNFEPADHHFYESKKVAVIGIELFDDLDKHFIPMVFDEIDVLKEGRYDIDVFYSVGNDRQVAEHAVDLITDADPNDVAIVMDTDGPIADAVRSALYREGIDFKNKMPARDIASVRDFLQFAELALSYDILTVGDVRELFAGYGAWTNDRSDEYLLSRRAGELGENMKRLADIMHKIRDHTFRMLCDKIVDDRSKVTVMMILDELDLTDRTIYEKTVGHASYLVNTMEALKHNVEIPESEKRGVLLADCGNSVFIDRPFVIYLNIDGKWSRPPAGKEYIDRKDEEEKEILRFQVLLQQGSSRVHIINTIKDGKPARPCPLFDRLNTDVEGELKKVNYFPDIVNSSVKKGAWLTPSEKVAERKRGTDVEAKELRSFSKSSLNAYITCPRAYMFSELIRTPDSDHTVFGNMIHEFAEFCLCYPEIANKNMAECENMISEMCAGISCPERSDVDRSRIRISVTNIVKFITSLGIPAVPLNVDISSRKRKNMFFERFGVSMATDIAESDHVSVDCPLHGEFDLIVGNIIIDYKTGRPESISDISKKMNLSKDVDFYETQPLVYLAILDSIIPKVMKEFMIFYTTDNDAEAAADPDFKIMRNTRTVRLLDTYEEGFIRSGKLIELVSDTHGREFIKGIGEDFNNALLEAGVDNADRWTSDEALFEKIFSLNKRKAEAEIRKAIKMAGEFISGRFISAKDAVIVLRGSLEKFKDNVREMHAEANERQISGFPCKPRKSCERCNFLSICTGGAPNDETE
ncbi:MAG: PD-(D/E)XK nuclease family protein [Methanomassiliicoccaceae archaeon]|nr:PD-(D/E)XK nuclease family protein [Methanomassiliicoccaceae archaeon]